MSDTTRWHRGGSLGKQAVSKRRRCHSGARRVLDGLHDALAGRLGRRRLHDDRPDADGSRDRRGGPGRRGRAHRGRGRGQAPGVRVLRAEPRRRGQPDRRRSGLEGTPRHALQPARGRLSIDTGVWNPDAPKPAPGEPDTRFAQTTILPSAIRIVATRSNTPLFFARVFGQDDFSVTSEAIARYQPRDIAVVLDFSGSMNDDSELKRIYQQGSSVKPLIEANLLQIYQDLGSPTYGNLQFTPQYISSTNNTTIKNTLGLNTVAYPYPSGSWNDYINYVKSSSSVRAARDYQKKYGYMTLINYWLENKAAHNQTPDLWKVSAQPITAVKDATDVFMDYIQEVDTDDRVCPGHLQLRLADRHGRAPPHRRLRPDPGYGAAPPGGPLRFVHEHRRRHPRGQARTEEQRPDRRVQDDRPDDRRRRESADRRRREAVRAAAGRPGRRNCTIRSSPSASEPRPTPI